MKLLNEIFQELLLLLYSGMCPQFLVAPPLPSGATYLVTTASVCMYVCMYRCSLVEIFFTKGFFFDTGFGLIHVQTGKKISTGDPPPSPPVKGKNFDTRFGLIHVQTGKKIFLMPIS